MKDDLRVWHTQVRTSIRWSIHCCFRLASKAGNLTQPMLLYRLHGVGLRPADIPSRCYSSTYRLAVHPGFSLLHSGGKLFQQYVADAYLQKLRYRRWTARRAMSVEILSTAAQLRGKSHLKGLQQGMASLI